jgi:hypothetical protein
MSSPVFPFGTINSADSQPTGQDRPAFEPKLARALADRRPADDETRAVVSLAYAMTAMIEMLEMATGRRLTPITRLRKVKRIEQDEMGNDRTVEDTVVETFEVIKIDLSAANAIAANLAKILAPVAEDGEGETIEQMTEARKPYMDELLAANREG